MGVKKSIDVSPTQRKIISNLLKKYLPNTEVWAYSSRVKWTAKPYSDLDMVVFTTKEQTMAVSDLREAFEESDLPFRVDFFVWDEVPGKFHENIKAECFVFQEANTDYKSQGLESNRKSFMQDKWKSISLKEALDFSNGKVSPKRNDNMPYPVYGSNGVIGFSDEFNSTTNTIVIGRVGSYCGSLYFSKKKCWVTDNAIKAHGLPKNDSQFLFYLLSSLNLNNWKSGSGQPLLNQSILGSIKAKIPGYKIQKTIASILSTLDSKAQLNLHINEILEEIAQTIFKSWFVDFDPVHAKKLALEKRLSKEQAERAAMAVISGICSPSDFAENFKEIDQRLTQKLSKMSKEHQKELAHTASLFPSEFENSELGEIPKGWKISSIGKELKLTMGQSPKGETYNESSQGVLFFQGRTDFGFRFPSPRMYTTDPRRMAKKGDTLISVRAPVGDKNLAKNDCCIGRGLAALKHRSDSISYTYYLISHIEGSLDARGGAGTVFSAINKDTLLNINIISPTDNLVKIFDQLLSPLDQKIESITDEIKTLEQLRDTLLPKLLAGEIDLSKIKLDEDVRSA